MGERGFSRVESVRHDKVNEQFLAGEFLAGERVEEGKVIFRFHVQEAGCKPT